MLIEINKEMSKLLDRQELCTNPKKRKPMQVIIWECMMKRNRKRKVTMDQLEYMAPMRF